MASEASRAAVKVAEDRHEAAVAAYQATPASRRSKRLRVAVQATYQAWRQALDAQVLHEVAGAARRWRSLARTAPTPAAARQLRAEAEAMEAAVASGDVWAAIHAHAVAAANAAERLRQRWRWPTAP